MSHHSGKGVNAPVLILNNKSQRNQGRKAQLDNVTAAMAVSDIIRTTLGPRAMLKMVLDPMGGIVLTNDGNCILREIDCHHPAAKSIIAISRTQDEEVGDGTTSVIILAGEMLKVATPFLERNMHPTIISTAYMHAMTDAIEYMKKMSKSIDLTKDSDTINIVRGAISTKAQNKWGDTICKLALDAVKTIKVIREDKSVEIDAKKYCRIEKIPGGMISDCKVLDGIVLWKDVLHPKMRRRIENPRIMMLDRGLEYKKGESQTNIEMKNHTDFEKYLKIEEDAIRNLCNQIIALKPDIVLCEKGCTDLAQHFLLTAGITVLRRNKKWEMNRLARAVGGTVCNRPEIMSEKDIGTRCGLYEVRKFGDEYFSFFEKCKEPKACSVILRGSAKDVLQEVDRNLQDAINVVRNVFKNPRILPGAGATEMAVARFLRQKAQTVQGQMAFPYKAVADALEIIPRTICQNCGADTIRVMTKLRALHEKDENITKGIDGEKGVICDVNDLDLWEPFVVKESAVKTSMEAACMLLRID
eukprot:UN24723